MRRILPGLGIILATGFTFASGDEIDRAKLPSAAKAPVDFTRDIKPLLEGRCLKCHSGEKPKGKFLLTSRDNALKTGDSSPNLKPGASADSHLIHYVAGLVDEKRMPPRGQGEPLTAAQIGLLRGWIDQGITWPAGEILKAPAKPKHWAFQAPVKAAPPGVENKAWPRTPIDYFILARLEKEGIKPNAEADKTTLLRRLFLDLIGLPPTPAEVDRFLADNSPEAYAKQVERLLESPHYGERWGRHWLDAARYADSDGYEKDMSRNVWAYRDWVVGAFNRDLPYDRFIVEQLAGDLLPNPTQDQLVATGFLRNSMLNEEGGVDPEQFRMDAMFDRMDAIGKSILGLTIQCCQCHAHKFDPMSQEEYYRFFAYLNNDHESQRVVYTPEQQMKVADIRRQVRDVEAGLRHKTPDWEARMAKWEESVKNNQPAWSVTALTPLGDADQRYFPQKDGSYLAQGYAPTIHDSEFTARSELPEIRSFRLELLNDPNLPAAGPGRSFKGTCVLTEFKVEVADVKHPGKKTTVKFEKATADYSNPEAPLEPNFDDKSGRKRISGGVELAIDGKDDSGWGIDAGPGRRNQERKAVFTASKNIAFPGGTLITYHLVQKHGGWNSDDHMNNNLGRFRLSVSGAANATADPLPRRVRDILSVPRDKRTPAQVSEVFSYWRTTVPEWKAANQQIDQLWKQWPEGATTLTLTQREEPRNTRILKRGDFLKPTTPVTAGVPAFLHPLRDPQAPGTRLTLANWLVDRRSPTTARAFVNRVWQAYFGTGLVVTSEDFGTQSDKPSHPELLDWLACEFMERGWSIKNLHRLIVNSATYRQASRLTPELLERDPCNRLLARGPRLRVEGEVVRDIALAASGLLNPRLGGPSIFSPAPGFLFLPPASYGPFVWNEATGPDRYRRALYTFRRRSTPYPALQTFDAPNGDFSCVRRTRSNTPLQALTTLNETIFMECARALAVRLLKEGGETDADRLKHGFRLCVGRPPTSEETSEVLALMDRERLHIAEGWVDPVELATGKKDRPMALPPGATPTQVAVYTVVARVLLNLDETITKE
jgi:hypothetical protein